VGGIIFQDESVLLVKRGGEPAAGQWSIPGGVVDTGETLSDAVVREVREETHIEVAPITLIKILDRIFRDEDNRVTYHYVLVDFLCRYVGGKVRAGTDALDAKFILLKDLASLNIIPVTREVIYQAANWHENLTLGKSFPGCGRIYDAL
jgi:ADP-ribose pyrophosphatase YjhB (NUDIX family)